MSVFVDVLIGTDGLRDWVQLPDKTKYMIGTTSVSKLVTELAPSGTARRTIEAFLAGNEARIRVDVDRLFALLAPTRLRLGNTTDPLIQQADRTSTTRKDSTMADYDQATKAAIQQQVANIEKHIALLNSHAKDASPGSISATMMKDEIEKLRDMAAWLKRPSPYGDQGKNNLGYGLPGGTPGGVKSAQDQQQVEQQQQAQQQAEQAEQQQKQAQQQVEAEQQTSAKKATTSKMSFDNLKANTALVESTLAAIDSTDKKIDRLAAAGKKFNAARAKADLHRVASRVSEIVGTVDLANGWIHEDLTKVAADATKIAALFPSDV